MCFQLLHRWIQRLHSCELLTGSFVVFKTSGSVRHEDDTPKARSMMGVRHKVESFQEIPSVGQPHPVFPKKRR